MSSTGTTVIKLQGGRSLLNSIFKFKGSSKLQKFIKEKGRIQKTLFTLAEILTVIKETVRREGLYDERNPPLIMCSEELESAINMKVLHISELMSIVLSHLQIISNEEFIERYCQNSEGLNLPIPTAHLPDFASSNVYRLLGTPLGKYTCKPEFLAVLQTMLEMKEDQKVFTFKEIHSLFAKYILKHKERFIDARNSKVAIIKGDLLETVFQVSAFHRCQTTYFIRRQLVPHADKSEGESSEFSSEEGAPASLLPQQDHVVARSRTRSATTTGPAASEYEPDSEDEQERPQLAGGRPDRDDAAGSSDSDSDTGQDFVLRNIPPIDPMTDVPYWGGISDDEELPQLENESKKPEEKICPGCGASGNHPLKLCPSCWRTRKNWFGSYIGKRKRKLQDSNKGTVSKSKLQVQLSSITPTPPISKNVSRPSVKDENLCLFCCQRPRDASFVHGRVGHQVCCYPCAKKTWIKGSRCPVCKRITEKIIRVVSS